MSISVPLTFSDSEESIILTDREVISKFPILVRAIESEHPEWATKECRLTSSIPLPFKKNAAEFLFTFVPKFKPVDPDSNDVNINDYQEANEKNLEELGHILELANFMECQTFMKIIGFVIAQKLNEMRAEEVAQFLGVECSPEQLLFDHNDGWINRAEANFQ
uniref:Skp1 domain-containing protein n=1 Tax=Caenorhabditis tropicalis TaxID=1561998 RepID=A0A1I7TTY0_9PELO